jgi:hypothetical protein
VEPSGNVVEQQVVSLEDEIEAEERRALAEQAEADRLSAIAAELAAQSRTRLTTVALARATLNGEQLPVLLRDDEPGCRESFPDWI